MAFSLFFQLSCWSANRSATLPISSTNPFLSIKRDFQPTVNFNTKIHCRSLIEYLPGEVWIGLDKLHQLTSERSFSLHINMTDYDGRSYVAVYDRFEVNLIPNHTYIIYFVIHLFSFIQMQCMAFLISNSISKQVGEGDGYVLIVGGFSAARSTLGDSMALSDRMKFSTK